MKLILLNIATFFSIAVYSQTFNHASFSKDIKISLHCIEESLNSVLEKIKTISCVNFIYDDELINNLKVSCQFDSSSIEEVLKNILNKHDISYKIYYGKYFVFYRDKKSNQKKYKAIIVNQYLSESDTIPIISKPKIISKNNLTYPSEALKNKIEGEVIVKFLVNREGKVSKSLVEKSSGSNVLDSAAVNYTSNLKFIPAQVNGEPHNVWISIIFKYYFTNLHEPVVKTNR